MTTTMRIGHGYDVHRLAENRPLILGGVHIDWARGLVGHSDGDVLLHALCDACLGAAGWGDIGRHFPPTDARYRGADSRMFVRRLQAMLAQANWRVANLDCTVVAERPLLAPHIPRMRENIADDLAIEADLVNVKATTTEGLGLCGREEGIAAYSVVLLAGCGG